VLLRNPPGNLNRLRQFRNYCGLINIARCGFPWKKTTKRPVASVYTNCETALLPESVRRLREGPQWVLFVRRQSMKVLSFPSCLASQEEATGDGMRDLAPPQLCRSMCRKHLLLEHRGGRLLNSQNETFAEYFPESFLEHPLAKTICPCGR
jgi:hypothetical protein